MDDCVFCKIINKQLPASIVYEDDLVLCFMDILPINPGACMVTPKVHINHFTDLPDELASHIVLTAQSIGRKLLTVVQPERIGYIVHGYGVAHAHFNILPLHQADDIASAKYAKIENGKIIFDHELISTADRTTLDVLARKLRS